MAGKTVSGIMMALLLVSMLTLAFNMEVHADRSLAPNGVRDITTYENRIGEQGLLIEDENLQMWVPQRYETHSRIIFDYLVAGHSNLSNIFGNHEYPYKFSVEHYPPGSPYFWGGTDARGTIRYGYSNLEDNTGEWNLYGVPHMRGYYEEMAHCFVYDFGVIGDAWGGSFSVGFYETLGLMIGSETALRAAYNPYVENLILNYYQTSSETTSYYLQHNAGPPGVGNNIWPTRVMSHMFKMEVVDVYGWSAFTNTFSLLKQEEYPLKQYDRDHTWGGFLNYLGTQTSSELNTIFADYGLPSLYWLEEGGYQEGLMRVDDTHSSFRVKCFDREGDQPSDVKLHVYSSPSSVYAMTFIGGNNVTGWVFEANVTLNGPTGKKYSFSMRDGAHSIFQGVGRPTLVHALAPPPSIHQGDLILTRNNVTTIEGRFDINGSIIVEGNATLILKNALINFTQTYDYQHEMTFRNSAKGNPHLLVDNATITTYYLFLGRFQENSTVSAHKLETPYKVQLRTEDSTVVSISSGSSIWTLIVADFSNVKINSSAIDNLYSVDSSDVKVYDSEVTSLYIGSRSVNSTISNLKPGLFSYWSFLKNCSIETLLEDSTPNVTLANTEVNRWWFGFEGSSNTTITSSIMSNIGTQHSSRLIAVDSTLHAISAYQNSIISLVNSTHHVVTNINSQAKIHVAWYLDVHVIDMNNQDVPLADVVATYPNGTVAESKLTDVNGEARLTLIEKIINATGEYHIGNYTVETTLGLYSSDTSVNMTGNKQITIALEKPSTPFEALNELIQTIKSYNLRTGIQTSLAAKLQAAKRSFYKENQYASKGQLTAFISHVEALRGKKLANDQADHLISEAQRVIDLIKG